MLHLKDQCSTARWGSAGGQVETCLAAGTVRQDRTRAVDEQILDNHAKARFAVARLADRAAQRDA